MFHCMLARNDIVVDDKGSGAIDTQNRKFHNPDNKALTTTKVDGELV